MPLPTPYNLDKDLPICSQTGPFYLHPSTRAILLFCLYIQWCAGKCSTNSSLGGKAGGKEWLCSICWSPQCKYFQLLPIPTHQQGFTEHRLGKTLVETLQADSNLPVDVCFVFSHLGKGKDRLCLANYYIYISSVNTKKGERGRQKKGADTLKNTKIVNYNAYSE